MNGNNMSPRKRLALGIGLACLASTPLSAAQADGHGPTFTNPVIDSNFPDPCILNDRGVYYAYSTNSGPNLPAQMSTDLAHWTPLPDAMPSLPIWAKPGRTWAPEVVKNGSKYIAYFAAHNRQTDKQALGVAVSDSPEGPFRATDEPLVDQAEIGGAIDPGTFTTSKGDRYLLWKNDGNSMSQDTWIWIQKLSKDGLSLEGASIKLIKQDQPWEWVLVEAPSVCWHDGKFYLFYSANFYGSCNYAMGYAVSSHLLGPYVKTTSTPWVSSSNDGCGPGGGGVFRTEDGAAYMAYHTWTKGPNSYRGMNIKRLDWNDGVPVLR